MARKTIAVDEALHALWQAEAKEKGQSLSAYVEASVEAIRTGEAIFPIRNKVTKVPVPARVKPADCKNRLRPGSFCRICQTIHKGK